MAEYRVLSTRTTTSTVFYRVEYIHRLLSNYISRYGNTGISFSDFFDTPLAKSASPLALGFDGFFRGAFSYHFHNFWSVINYLVARANSFFRAGGYLLTRHGTGQPLVPDSRLANVLPVLLLVLKPLQRG